MNRYTIHCTKEQTEKAWKLGAPLFCLDRMQSEGFDENPYKDDYKDRTKLNIGLYAFCPTTEQMIGWLEEKHSLQLLTGVDGEDKFFFNVYHTEGRIEVRGRNSRKEATLAAIDAALEYLSKKQMEE